jgi:hypothetical protein
MSNTITITINVSITPVSSRDTSGGTVSVRIPLIDLDSGEARNLAELRAAAVERACARLYGRTTFWWPDSGLPGYGQVMRPCKTGGSTAVTYRASLDVEIPQLPEEHLAALHQRATRLDEYYRQCDAARRAGYASYPAACPRGASHEFADGWFEARDNALLAEDLR